MVFKKVLFCATVDYHFKAFHLPYLKWFADQGWEVHVAANGDIHLPYVTQKYNIPLQRSPLSIQNIRAYKELQSIIHRNKYNIVHCHTPMGGAITRLATRKARRKGTTVIYTAHGFHFCKGASFINWLLYYPIERSLATVTDCLITINQEDYNLAVKHHFQAKDIKLLHGVGIDIERFIPVTEAEKRELKQQLGYNPQDFFMFYAAEFNKNKNQSFLIRVVAQLKSKMPRAKLLLAGEGPLVEECKKLATQLGVSSMVHFLGYRNDIASLLQMCDLAVASSYREGLPVNIMEAMACGLPVVATDNRGHRELIIHNTNGWIIERDDIKTMSERIHFISKNTKLQAQFGQCGRTIIASKYSVNEVLKEKREIYTPYMDEMEDLNWALH
ncbi:glycosyltransferase family 4 protein [Bacillus paranthracis]|uniref:glycosyltransferase family 4 protein n=1 Tax=Bacillus cereus group TaxID=86661 RepID=UPI000C34A973|nr:MULTISPECIES: glycosyltransferase family 4 protein [Bacillus cereus group]MBL3844704.1 glycosyltransferase family 4 protein [Bacillus cereus]MDA1588028.1 glycosyltransferase family 4 protein [Bacillus cereus group sp. TH225LC]MDA1888979.1 glycosyltransferase family 4 protein [Bacillus cereus group sp. BY11-1LC]MDA2588956.1 glycosyltransferase family 4 protein [Bacillus cereus group sp. Bc065]MDK7440279.1 glycosyltransferase family 4 protein [Bacillus paranthracis]